MADIFISYSRKDHNFAQQLSDVLIKSGLSVWWDRRLNPSDDFNKTIKKEIQNAIAVIILWSHDSVDSLWVRGEANLAVDLNKAVPIRVDDCELPIRFLPLHTPDVFKSKAEFEKLLEFLQNKINHANSNDKKLSSVDLKKNALESIHSNDFWNNYWDSYDEGYKRGHDFGKKHPFLILFILIMLIFIVFRFFLYN